MKLDSLTHSSSQERGNLNWPHSIRIATMALLLGTACASGNQPAEAPYESSKEPIENTDRNELTPEERSRNNQAIVCARLGYGRLRDCPRHIKMETHVRGQNNPLFNPHNDRTNQEIDRNYKDGASPLAPRRGGPISSD